MSGLAQDAEGTIWLHNFFGEILYVKDNQLHKLESWESRYKTGFPSITVLDSTTIIHSPSDLYEYTPKSKKWFEWTDVIKKEHGDSTLLFTHHIRDQQKKLWIAYSTSENTFIRRLPLDKKVYKFNSSQNGFSPLIFRLIPWNNRLMMFDSKTNTIGYVGDNGLEAFIPATDSIIQDTRQVYPVNDSILAFTGPKGIHLLNKNINTYYTIKGINVSHVIQDREGGFWITTLNEGILYIRDLNSVQYSKANLGLHTRILTDKKNTRIIAGGYDGQLTVIPVKGKPRKFRISDTKNEIQAMFLDTTANQLLVSSDKLYWVDLETFKVMKSMTSVAVKAIVRDENNYYLATSNGAIKVNCQNMALEYLIPNQRISAIAVDSEQKQIWIGTQKGVFTSNLKTSLLTPWTPPDGTPSPGISAILSTSNYIILGSQTNGLFLTNSNKTIHITTQDGLLSNKVKRLYSNGNILYAGTDKGISVIDLKTITIKNLTEINGLESGEIYDLTTLQNQLWVSHPGGIQQFTKPPRRNLQIPEIHIESIRTDQSYPFSDSMIVLPPDNRRFTITFNVSNNLRSRGQTEIYYRIRELGDNWNRTTLASPLADFVALPTGMLQLEAYAVNEDGIESAKLKIAIHVQAPFWETNWFIGVMVAILIVTIMTIVQSRLVRINNRNKARLQEQNQEQELIIAQLTSIRAQMNPHFIFNTMSSIQGKVMNGMKEEANLLIQQYSGLMRKVLDISDHEMILVDDEISIIEKYLTLEKDRFSGDFQYNIKVDPVLTEEFIRIPTLITQPFVENALRHGLMHKIGAKILEISFYLQDGWVIITIDDNGIGREASAQINLKRKRLYSSFALGAYRKRIELLNKNRIKKIQLNIDDKRDPDGKSCGTFVSIRIPLEFNLHERT